MNAKLLVTMPEMNGIRRATSDVQRQEDLDLALATLADILKLTGIEMCVVPSEVNQIWLMEIDDSNVNCIATLDWERSE